MRKGCHIIWLESTDSTNSEVRRMSESLDNLSIVASVWQSDGRGQGNHIWLSERGANLTFSLFLRFDGNGPDVGNLTRINEYITGVLVDFLALEGIDAWVKPPNDIWVEDKKIAGILIENKLSGRTLEESIVGVGLNLNQTKWDSELPNPVSMKQLTGRSYAPEAVLRSLGELLYARRIIF